MNEIENKIVQDSHWRELEKKFKVYGECAGCEEPIVEGEDYYEMDSTNHEIIMVHQHPGCCMNFVGELARCRTAGEE